MRICPDWLLRLSEALSGYRLNQQGILEPTELDRAKTIAQIREDLKHLPDQEDGVRWGRWLLSERTNRTISPFSSLTVSEYINNLIDDPTKDSLESAEQLAAGNAELMQRISSVREKVEKEVCASANRNALPLPQSRTTVCGWNSGKPSGSWGTRATLRRLPENRKGKGAKTGRVAYE